MKITSVTAITGTGEDLRFDLRNVSSATPYLIKNIVGLDADEIIPKFYGFGLNGSNKFYDLSLKERTLVIRIVLNPRFHLDEDYSYLRGQIYTAISSSRTGRLELQFHAGASTVAHVFGFITKMEVALFTKVPELQITFKCDDPMLRSINPTIMEAPDLGSSSTVVVADSASTAPHGFAFTVTFTGTVASFVIQDTQTDPNWTFTITPASSFLSGDKLYFSSEFKNKYLYRVRSGATLHMLDRIAPTSIWPILFPGFNDFYFAQKASFTWDSIEYHSSFWGV